MPSLLVIMWLDKLLSLFFPDRCFLCRKIAPGGICSFCIAAFPRINGTRCSNCGLVLLLPRCPCSEDKYYFSKLASYGYYDESLKKAIGLFKYKSRKSLAQPLGLLLAAYWQNELCWSNVSGIVPIPLHNDTLKLRGFNQSLLLAEVVGSKFKLPVSSFLIKVRYTLDQSTLSAKDRQENVKGAFSVLGTCNWKHVVLIDDVFTTGATVNEASRVLKEAGVNTVFVLTLARSRFRDLEVKKCTGDKR